MRYQCGGAEAFSLIRAIWRDEWGTVMNVRIANAALVSALLLACLPASVYAQDVPGIEICTVEKTMERRTSCLQSNVDFLQKTITKLALDQQRRIDAANRQIDALKANVASLEKLVEEQKKSIEEVRKAAE